jgi:hypothetical protein
VGVRRTSPESEATLMRRWSAVGQGRSARRLGASKKKMWFFLCSARGSVWGSRIRVLGWGGLSTESYRKSPLPVDVSYS